MTFKTNYRTKDGNANYGFSIERLSNGNYRVYIDGQPSYGSRNTGFESTHRLSDGGRHYVCWTGALKTLSEAKHVAARWADNTQQYIKSGRRF